jgi:hypothetical protein
MNRLIGQWVFHRLNRSLSTGHPKKTSLQGTKKLWQELTPPFQCTKREEEAKYRMLSEILRRLVNVSDTGCGMMQPVSSSRQGPHVSCPFLPPWTSFHPVFSQRQRPEVR